eukprot:356930-Chlamydomonas_euryale.AAC.11
MHALITAFERAAIHAKDVARFLSKTRISPALVLTSRPNRIHGGLSPHTCISLCHPAHRPCDSRPTPPRQLLT